MKYSKHYTKLDKDEYTTIRRYRKAKNGTVVKETYPDGEHNALICEMWMTALKNLSLEFLQNDTDKKTRKGAYALIQSFYRKKIDFNKEIFTIYFMRKTTAKVDLYTFKEVY